MLPPTRPILSVDLDALARNAAVLRARAGPAELACVVKADAYGLGAAAICETLARRCGVGTLFVAFAAEAEPVRAAAPDADIYVLNGFEPYEADRFVRLGLRPVLEAPSQVAAWSAAGGGPCALGVDVGMNRLGLSPGELAGVCDETGLEPRDVTLVVMHLSHASDTRHPRNTEQVELFERVASVHRPRFPNARFSLSASGGIELPHAPSERLVRPGISLYGGSPTGEAADALEPVATFTAPVLALRDVEVGETAGYDGRWRASRPSRLAILGAGYADGVRRSARESGFVVLDGMRCPFAGTVSMDSVIVDATDATSAKVGDRAELFGRMLSVDEAARAAGTIAYDLLCGIGPRVERVYEGQASAR